MFVDLKQRHIEKFEQEMARLADELDKAFYIRVSNDGATVRAAIAAEWFDEKPASVANMTVSEVHKLANAVNEAYKEATEIDPN